MNRPMRPEDVPWVAALEAGTFPTPWDADAFRRLLGRSGVLLRVREDADACPVAYGVLWCAADQGELANLAVRADARGRGHGGALLDHLLAAAAAGGVRAVFLEVRASNDDARRLYRTRGFREVGVRAGYYRSPREDAVVMRADPGGKRL
ncbi:MAG: ribosomal protein S18-alanine N-acetyltransferase [Longimicrobiales bacterium]|nr:ribosomal protein S18-alanine N-acetyltransferase [Longimicrobiales bacterium]